MPSCPGAEQSTTRDKVHLKLIFYFHRLLSTIKYTTEETPAGELTDWILCPLNVIFLDILGKIFTSALYLYFTHTYTLICNNVFGWAKTKIEKKNSFSKHNLLKLIFFRTIL